MTMAEKFPSKKEKTTMGEKSLETTAQKRDWSQLFPDLILLIAGKLTVIPDLIRFRFVCTQWRRQSPVRSPTFPPPQLPWFLLPQKRPTGSRLIYTRDGSVEFLSVSENRHYNIPLPDEFRSSDIFTASSSPEGGWLIAVSYRLTEGNTAIYSIFLVNPITRSTISLPILPLWHLGWDMECLKVGYHICNAKLLGTTGSDRVLFFTQHRQPGFFLCRLSEPAWNHIVTERAGWYPDAIVHRGSLVFLNQDNKKTSIYDVASLDLVSEVPAPPFKAQSTHMLFNLVESLTGELLLVIECYLYDKEEFFGEKEFQVFRLHESGKQLYTWEEISGIGDHCFMFHTSFHAMCFSSSHFNGVRGNCIYYFLDSRGEEIQELKVGAFDLKSKRNIERFLINTDDGPWRNTASFNLFIPSL